MQSLLALALAYEALFINNDKRPATHASLCSVDGCVETQPVSCEAGARCRVKFMNAPDRRMYSVKLSNDGQTWSPESNQVDILECSSNLVCKFDYDRDGSVGLIDFKVFLLTLGLKRF